MADNNSINTANQNSEVKAYIVNDSIAQKQITMAFVMIVIGFFVLVLLHRFTIISLSIFYLFVGFWQKNRKTIILFDKYIEFKGAPAGSTKQIKYKDIKRIEDISEKKVIIHSNDGKKARIPVALISYEDRRDLLNRLNEAIAA